VKAALEGKIVSKVETKIKECIAELKEFEFTAPVFFAPAIDRIIEALGEVESLISNLNEENRKRALEVVTEFLNRTAAYQRYFSRTTSIDRSISNLEYIKGWLEKQKVGTLT